MLNYKLSFLDGQEVLGAAEQIFFKDSVTIMTLKPNGAPVIALLKNGSLSVTSSEGVKSFSYIEGFVKSSGSECVISILKY